MENREDCAIARLAAAKKSAEEIFQKLLDLGLIKSWYYNGTFHVETVYDGYETSPHRGGVDQ